MARVRIGRLRATTAALAALAMMAAPVTALAQATTPEPVITSAPAAVAFKASAVIAGRLDGGTPGQTIRLQRLRTDGGWRRIGARPTDENNRVRFRLED